MAQADFRIGQNLVGGTHTVTRGWEASPSGRAGSSSARTCHPSAWGRSLLKGLLSKQSVFSAELIISSNRAVEKPSSLKTHSGLAAEVSQGCQVLEGKGAIIASWIGGGERKLNF